MTTDREKDIFFGALELGPDAREDYLARHCAGDGPMLARLRALLAAHEQAQGFMGAPTIDQVGSALASVARNPRAAFAVTL